MSGPVPVECVVLPHKTVPVVVVVDVDEGIAHAVEYLNAIPGVRTFASCQGTIGEGGASPYPTQVLIHCSEEILQSLTPYFTIGERIGGECCYIHLRPDVELPRYDGFLSYHKDLEEAIAQRDAACKSIDHWKKEYETVSGYSLKLRESTEKAEAALAAERAVAKSLRDSLMRLHARHPEPDYDTTCAERSIGL
jgi:hypothetical protein